MGFFSGIADFVTDTVDSITGVAGKRAAQDASQAQLEATEKAIEYQKETRDLARSDLAPFKEAGQSRLNTLASIMDSPRRNVDPYAAFRPAYMALSEDVANRNAAQGKLGSGNFMRDLFRNSALLGEQMRNDRMRLNEGFRMNDINSNLNFANMGQASAAGQANAGLQTGNAIADLYTQGGNAQAAGLIGAQNAANAGVNNLLGLVGMFL